MRYIFLFLSLIIIACKGPEGPRGPAGPPGSPVIYVSGYIYPSCYDTLCNFYYTHIDVAFPPSVPYVKLNDEEIPLQRWDYYYSTYVFHYDKYDTANFSPGDEILLEVVYKKPSGKSAKAYTQIHIPGDFDIISPDTSEFCLQLGSSLTIEWTESQGADCYRAYLYLHYHYYDTSGYYKCITIEKDTTINSTSVIFPAEALFPNIGEISQVDYSYGYSYVWAQSGPVIKEGEMGNIRGDGYGFFWSTYYGGYLNFYICGTALMNEEKFEPFEVYKKLIKLE